MNDSLEPRQKSGGTAAGSGRSSSSSSPAVLHNIYEEEEEEEKKNTCHKVRRRTREGERYTCRYYEEVSFFKGCQEKTVQQPTCGS